VQNYEEKFFLFYGKSGKLQNNTYLIVFHFSLDLPSKEEVT
jgi:hypothetical protein